MAFGLGRALAAAFYIYHKDSTKLAGGLPDADA